MSVNELSTKKLWPVNLPRANSNPEITETEKTNLNFLVNSLVIKMMREGISIDISSPQSAYNSVNKYYRKCKRSIKK